jgi:hypothetical protein
MNRWSVSKIFKQVSLEDFSTAVKALRQSMEESCATPMTVDIKLYRGIPHFVTTIVDEGTSEWLRQDNLKKVFKNAAAPDEITQAMWDLATYAEATIRPADKTKAPPYTFGHLEPKGLMPKQIGFYVQPEKVGEPAKRQSLQSTHKNWRKGDGMTHNASVSLR